ncbi:MAG: hypothetical protein DLM72_04310 [Candidatus Nitrosopolaris wilkensis]|nr:MAG: hypothetical protein DLM72_04310 [Candidatus Nitrosopolaris wilkensis]
MSSVDQNPIHDLESLNWDDLLSLKRSQLNKIKDLTDKIIDIEKNRFRLINENIQHEKNKVVNMTTRLAQIRTEMNSSNSQLLTISEKISKSKNFVSIMGTRLPSDNEGDLVRILESSQKLVDEKRYKNERQKNEALSVMNDASMKLEAIKAIRTVNEQLIDLNAQAEEIKKILKILENEDTTLQTKIADTHNKIDKLFVSKRQLAAEHQSCLKDYDEFLSTLDSVNSRLDAMALWRKRQRQEYGYRPGDDALFKVKESAKKKFEAGAKLSFEELKLLYDEDKSSEA